MSEEKNENKNIVTVEDTGSCRKKVKIEIPEESVKEILNEQYKELRKDADLPGFRKGRAPIRLLEKRFGKEIKEQAKLQMLSDAAEQAIKDQQLNILAEPNIDPKDYELPDSGAFKFEFEANVRPEVDLPDLSSIELEKPSTEVTEKEIEDRIKRICENFGELEDKGADAEVEENDTIIADTKATVTDNPESCSENNDVPMEIGKSCFIGPVYFEDLKDKFLGAKVGDVIKFSEKASEDCGDENFAGKKCDFEVKIKKIQAHKPAELNEEFFDKLNIEDETDFREKVTDLLEDQKERSAKDEMHKQVREYLKENTSFELPEKLVDEQTETLVNSRYSQLLAQDLDPQQLKEKTAELQTSCRKEAEEQVKMIFVLQKVAQELDIEATPQELNGYIYQMAQYSGTRPEKMREQLTENGTIHQIQREIVERKALDALVEKNLPDDSSDSEEGEQEEKPEASGSQAGEEDEDPQQAQETETN